MNNSLIDHCADHSLYHNAPVGVLFIAHTLLYYQIPCTIVMMRAPLKAQSAYKIMSALAVVDMTSLLGNGLAAGVWSVLGTSFCDQYWPMKVVGALTNGCWISYCALCVSLSINRVTDFTTPVLHKKLFDGNKTYSWICGSFLWGAVYTVCFLTPACTLIYHAGWGTYLFDPAMPTKLGKWMNTFVDVLAPSIMIVCYVILGKHACSFTSMAVQALDSTAQAQRRMTLTAVLVCLFATYAAVSYPVLNTIHIGEDQMWILTASHLMWQMAHGSNCFIYLFLNKTIRTQVKHLLGMQHSVAPLSFQAGKHNAEPMIF